MKKATMYIDEGKRIATSDYDVIVQFADGETNTHKFVQYSYEDVFKAIVEHYKDKEERKSILRILIETR
ncbi:hypothetical protein [Paenisporosarcina sp. NPDC076898]|uniref:hypothetical protein n=1 Tax=unclassified Paenisporosarcina TaxID=2642018 RepID=UPI003D022B10